MMSAPRTRRRPRSLASERTALRAIRREDDDYRLRVDVPLEEMLPAGDLVSKWADIDDADGSDMDRAVELAGVDIVGEDVSVPIIPKRADEFTCSSCFLIHHVSCLASSTRGQLICTDCA